ncbi:MAG TPA: xanthine permease [Armatimonadetes bacterium]|nr:xanthine permease [Armatimonadota bacterium]
MAKRPPNLTYAVDENPPALVSAVLGLQHLCVVAISFVFPVVVIRQMGGTHEQAEFMVNMSMLAAGIGTVIQAFPRGPIGSGYLCPMVCGPSYLTASLVAAQAGGLSLVCGMTALSALIVVGASRIMNSLRVLFPTEVVGLVVAMVGITVLKLSVTSFLGLDDQGRLTGAEHLVVGVVTLATICILNVWGRGFARLACVVIGMGVGYIASAFFGMFTTEHSATVALARWIAFPFTHHPGFSFDAAMIVPFVVAAVCSLLKNVGDITTCQKINDADWQRTDMPNVSKGMLADGLGCLVAGLVGGHGLSGSSSNIGLSVATGATSRVVAYIAGGMLVLMAFCPKLSSVFAIMPSSVIGAVLLFAVSFMVIAGIEILASRMLDARKTIVVGLALLAGLSVDMLPDVVAQTPKWAHPLLHSSLSTATIVVIVLNLVFRIGIRRRAATEISPDDDAGQAVFEFFGVHGGRWAARRDVIERARAAGAQLVEAIRDHQLSDGTVRFEAAFDELNLAVDVSYDGRGLYLAERPPAAAELLERDDASLELAGYLVRHHSDTTSIECRDGHCRIHLGFAHA